MNAALGPALDADHCFDCSRVLRLPWTVNFPNAGKRAKGRGVTVSSLIEFSAERACTFEEMRAAVEPFIGAAKQADAQKAVAELNGWAEIDAAALIESLPGFLKEWLENPRRKARSSAVLTSSERSLRCLNRSQSQRGPRDS